jgi:hypothetical protein
LTQIKQIAETALRAEARKSPKNATKSKAKNTSAIPSR